jgi:hypothetical protein
MKKISSYLLFILISVNVFAQVGKDFKPYVLPNNVSNSDIKSDVIVFKLKESTAIGVTTTRIADSKFQLLATQIGATNIKQCFPNAVAFNKNLRTKPKADYGLDKIYEFKISDSKKLFSTINQLIKSGLVDYAEPKFVSHSLYVPNDPNSDSLTGATWHLQAIKAYEAWNNDSNRGDTNTILGIIDTGFLNSHIEFSANIKYNKGEMGDGKESNNIDDDLDGYVDNWAGYDVADNDNDPTFHSGNNHGIAVAGLSSATPDNDTLIAGTGFHSKFIPIKASKDNSGGIDAGYEGITYAIKMGCKVVNLSWGHTGYSQSEADFINDAVTNHDLMIIAAAGNTASPEYYFPASFDHVMSVTYSDYNDVKSGGNYNVKVDIDAPGNNVKTISESGLRNSNGSSVASPIVAGAAVALRAKFPLLSGVQIAEILRMSADVIDTMSSNAPYKGLMGRGRLNMAAAFNGMQTSSVRLNGISFLNKSNNSPIAGDTALFACEFVNYLLPTTSDFKIKISIDNPYITLIDSVFDAGALSTLALKDNGTLPFRFIIAPNAPFDLLFKVDFKYIDLNYNDYEGLELVCNAITNLDLNVNQASLTISSKGRNGFSNSPGVNGNGLKYKGKSYLFSSGLMVATSDTKVSDGTNNNHFTPTQNTQYVVNPIYGQLISSKFDDSNNLIPASKVGVSIAQKSFAWNTTGLNKTLVIEYKVTNTSGAKFDSICIGLFNDLDVDGDNYNTNVTKWDNDHHVGYAYNLNINSLAYAGVKLLTPQKENFFAMDNDAQFVGNIDPNSQFNNANKFTALSSGIARTDAGVAANGADVSMVIGATVYDLDANETTTVAIAYIMADNEQEMLDNADAIQAKYIQIRKGLTPLNPAITICKDNKATLNPTNGSSFEYYKSTTIDDANKLASGASYLSNNLSTDTAFYIVNRDSLFVSDALKVNVNIAKLNPDFTYTLDNGIPGKVNFESANNVNNWNWNYGDNSAGNGQLSSNVYATPSIYDVKLVLTNNIGCKDSITKQVEVNNFITNSNININLKQGEKFNIYPNPSTGTYHLELSLDSKQAIVISVYDAIGNVVYSNKSVPSEIDLSNVTSGIYILKVQAGERVLTQKLYLGNK